MPQTMRRLLPLFILAFAASLRAQSIPARLDSLLAANAALTDRILVGISVYDLTADSPVYAHNARQTMRPASNMKLITAITALDRLGTDYQYQTVFHLDTTQLDANGTLRDRLFVRGGMDPLLKLSDLDDAASALADLGIREIAGGLCFDRSFKDGKRWGEGWCWDDDEDTNPTLDAFLMGGGYSFEDALLIALSHYGIRVTGYASQAAAPERADLTLLLTHTVSSVLQPMMKRSDNLCAESLFYQLAATEGGAYASREPAAAAIGRLVERLGLTANDYYFADGSGVSLYNYASPELLVALLRYAFRNEGIYRTLLPSLPIAGEDGTLARRMTDTSAAGNVRAKTGTETAVSTLSGYCTTADGHRLCFSLMMQGQRRAAIARTLQDAICVELTR